MMHIFRTTGPLTNLAMYLFELIFCFTITQMETDSSSKLSVSLMQLFRYVNCQLESESVGPPMRRVREPSPLRHLC